MDSTAPPGAPSAAGDDDLAQIREHLTRAVSRVCPHWLADRSEDLVQVALMRVMEIRRKGEGTARFNSFYLQRAAYSALIDEIRRLRRRQEVTLEGDSPELNPATEAPDPERNAAGRELGKAIRECLSRLVAPRRYAVTLHLQGHSVPEAARLLGWSAKRAENLVYRGLADLRACLSSKGVTR